MKYGLLAEPGFFRRSDCPTRGLQIKSLSSSQEEFQLDNINASCGIYWLKIKNQSNGMEMDYTLVADGEADLASGKISVNSPIGKGLLGKSVGDVAQINVPSGVINFEIIEISR